MIFFCVLYNIQPINMIFNVCIHFSKRFLQSDFELYGSMRRNRQSAWDLNDNRQTRLSTFQVPSAQTTAVGNDQSMRLRSSQDRSVDFYSHRSPSYEVKRKLQDPAHDSQITNQPWCSTRIGRLAARQTRN